MMTVFMIHFKLAHVRRDVLMIHKNCRQLGISDTVMGRVSWVTRVTGHQGRSQDFSLGGGINIA